MIKCVTVLQNTNELESNNQSINKKDETLVWSVWAKFNFQLTLHSVTRTLMWNPCNLT